MDSRRLANPAMSDWFFDETIIWNLNMRCVHCLIGCWLMVVLVMVASIGCTPPDDPVLDLMDTDLRKTKIDDLTRTMGFIFSERRFDQQEFESNVASGLNRWVSYATDKVSNVEWVLDPLAEPLQNRFEGLSILERTGELSFVDADAYYIQESAWLSQIFKRTVESTHLNAIEFQRLAADDFKPTDETEDPIVQVVQRLHPDLNHNEATKLANVFTYFDWIIRNVQLLPNVDHSGDDLDELRLNDREDPAAAGIAGTGYQRFPWQTLLYARGDYVDRAKLLMVGLQHQGFSPVMLAVSEADKDQPSPWVVAVPIGKEYYLFDTKMGLPIPGKKLGSFATLSEIRANPNLIDNLDLRVDESLEDETNYWVTGEQLKKLVGLIYVTPEGISRRMKALESRLIGAQRLVLTNQPSVLKQSLPATDGLDFKVWEIAFKTHQFRQAVREALKDTQDNVLMDRLRWYYEDEAYIDVFTRYRTARARFFGGKFESERGASGFNTIESFEHLIYSNQDIADLATDTLLQQRLGILQPEGSDEAQNAADFNRQLSNVQAHMRLVRRDTGFFLAQAHFDNGSVSAAANWLKLLREEDDADRWLDGINYLLGRALESRKEYDLAIAEYRSDTKASQSHGNLIRARLLSAIVKQVFGEVVP